MGETHHDGQNKHFNTLTLHREYLSTEVDFCVPKEVAWRPIEVND